MADESQQHLNHNLVDYPTDRVTLGQMRRLEGAWADLVDDLATKTAVFGGHATEILLAEKAFAAALGRADPHPMLNRAELVEFLNDTYTSYGLSRGMHETRRIAKGIEASAVRLARSGQGR